MNELSSPARNSTVRAISSGVACRASGMRSSKSSAARLLLAGGADLDPVLERVVHRPGMDAVDANAAVGDLPRRGPHQPDDRVLGRRVPGDRRVGHEADDARVEDQAAAVAHGRQRVLCDQERSAHVDRHHAIEDLLGVVDDRRVDAEHPRVGERDVEPAEALQRERHRGPHLGRVGDVGHRRGGAIGADLVDERRHSRLVEVGDHDPGALGGEQPRGRGADAAATARDQRHLVLQPGHEIPLVRPEVGYGPCHVASRRDGPPPFATRRSTSFASSA
jgi:hypothetical protein